ncbi:MAG: hypothetical protein KDJ34_17710 [Candidatus Competibacteraceae bacterium]|nr:hypothetical protein [Candidatus Competibacteraceae bacterium]
MSVPAFGLFFRRYAPFETFGLGFEGDKRTKASTSLQATSRTYGWVAFNQFEILHQFADSSGTNYHSSVWGDITGHSKVSMKVTRSKLAGPGLIEFSASTAGANPLVPGAPDIDTSVTVRIDFSKNKSMIISGKVFGDDFPNLEVFLKCYRSNHTALLVDGRTTGGRNTGPFARLAGSHSNQLLCLLNANLPLTEKGTLSVDYSTKPIEIPIKVD